MNKSYSMTHTSRTARLRLYLFDLIFATGFRIWSRPIHWLRLCILIDSEISVSLQEATPLLPK